MIHVKKAQPAPPDAQESLQQSVTALLAQLQIGREATAQDMSQRLDGYFGPLEVIQDAVVEACARVPQALKDDICYAHENIATFAATQRNSIHDIEVELRPGLRVGQRLIPVDHVGCYVPGGRYSHIASAIMTVTTAKAAGVRHIAAVSPPRLGAIAGIPDSIIYTLNLCGADRILALGGVQGIAAMAYGMFGLPKADILVGPGNQYVAEAKRQLYGAVGIDMVAGPTDSMVVADHTADPFVVAWDLIGQAEHGANSPVWLVTDSANLATEVARLAPICAKELPEPNRTAALAAWQNLGEIIVCADREAMATYADAKAPEHLHIQANDLEWWKGRLRAYGSLFLGANTTVAFGDKAAGSNHVLPTSGAARYTGGLSVHKFIKTVTWQQVDAPALEELARVTAAISRYEGMEGHARTADIRRNRPRLGQ
ncbi:MAG: histidinol dehydrogenase [Paracoccaceae bacterium]|jgi:sulfopropanediol 3-dehydrogenase|nr:histidinol dehydrogenase [Paracoccaceae bacterium]HCM98603.1 histidinol dehydrogenase [Rhodobacter sp.]MDO7633531.1 histidinol dehydrogenase [Paracoccaceae bacterium]MDO7656315.1 histidinol dehydrogenase [Paracoccaceae bacterium]MDO7658535.1 histidinol dehydrogenase [Paracoccaceae bacterium]